MKYICMYIKISFEKVLNNMSFPRNPVADKEIF